MFTFILIRVLILAGEKTGLLFTHWKKKTAAERDIGCFI